MVGLVFEVRFKGTALMCFLTTATVLAFRIAAFGTIAAGTTGIITTTAVTETAFTIAAITATVGTARAALTITTTAVFTERVVFYEPVKVLLR